MRRAAWTREPLTRCWRRQVSLPDREDAQAGRGRAELTDREVDVLRAISRGLSEQADRSRRPSTVSGATVHTHIINVYGKIGVNTRAGATLFAFEHDLISATH